MRTKVTEESSPCEAGFSPNCLLVLRPGEYCGLFHFCYDQVTDLAMIASQLPHSNALSHPPPPGGSVALLKADEAMMTFQSSPTSLQLNQPQLPVTRTRPRTHDLAKRLNKKSPRSVGPWLASSLQDRWQSYHQQLQLCRHQFSEEAVHELRVATRRLMALLTLLSSVSPGAMGETATRILKSQLKALNDLRDTHVQRAFFQEQIPRFPELFLVCDFLQRRERRLVKVVDSKLEGFKTRKLDKAISSLRADLHSQSADWSRPTQLLAAVMRGTTKAFAVAVARHGAIDPADPVTIHRTRVAFKRFRYMVECLSPAFTGLGKRALRPLAIYQRRMGILQDLEIMRHCLERFSKDHEGTEDLLRPFCRQLQRRRTRSLRRFLRSADHLLNFWPPRSRASGSLGS